MTVVRTSWIGSQHDNTGVIYDVSDCYDVFYVGYVCCYSYICYVMLAIYVCYYLAYAIYGVIFSLAYETLRCCAYGVLYDEF